VKDKQLTGKYNYECERLRLYRRAVYMQSPFVLESRLLINRNFYFQTLKGSQINGENCLIYFESFVFENRTHHTFLHYIYAAIIYMSLVVLRQSREFIVLIKSDVFNWKFTRIVNSKFEPMFIMKRFWFFYYSVLRVLRAPCFILTKTRIFSLNVLKIEYTF
jgi:hypothetical protein